MIRTITEMIAIAFCLALSIFIVGLSFIFVLKIGGIIL